MKIIVDCTQFILLLKFTFLSLIIARHYRGENYLPGCITAVGLPLRRTLLLLISLLGNGIKHYNRKQPFPVSRQGLNFRYLKQVAL